MTLSGPPATRRRTLRKKEQLKAASAVEVTRRPSLRKKAQIKAASAVDKAASAVEERKRKAASAVDVGKILKLKKEALEAIRTKCFPLTAKWNQTAMEARPSAADEEKKKRKVVKQLVPQALIDHLKAGLFHCIDEMSEDELAQCSQAYRDNYHAKMLLTEKVQACQQSLLDQYDQFGYAYDVTEVTDDEEEVTQQQEEQTAVVVKN